ncbi:MAG: sigma-70 family RNA polymerase sigma factor [Phycisphaerales bacterium]
MNKSGYRPVLERVAQGEQAAVEECMDQFGGLVWSLARRMMPDSHTAEDAVQDIFVDVWKNAARYDSSMGSEATFIATIARRRLIDRLRRIGRRPSGSELNDTIHSPLAEGEAEGAVDLSERAQAAREALSELSEDQQRVLQLALFHGQTHEKIASATGLPLGTVKTHARRGLMKVREALNSLKSSQEQAGVTA